MKQPSICNFDMLCWLLGIIRLALANWARLVYVNTYIAHLVWGMHI
jgi:hypothetical protein